MGTSVSILPCTTFIPPHKGSPLGNDLASLRHAYSLQLEFLEYLRTAKLTVMRIYPKQWRPGHTLPWGSAHSQTCLPTSSVALKLSDVATDAQRGGRGLS